jgi:MFS family permease
MSPEHAGVLLTVQPTVMAIVAPLSGLASDRFGSRVLAASGMFFVALGVALVAIFRDAGDVALASALAVVGLGAGLFVTPNNAEIMSAASRDRQSTAAAMAATARNVGMSIGVALAASFEPTLGLRGTLLASASLAAAVGIAGALRAARAF